MMPFMIDFAIELSDLGIHDDITVPLKIFVSFEQFLFTFLVSCVSITINTHMLRYFLGFNVE